MNKDCPVVLRTRNGGLEFLTFKHPTIGYQIVKGTIETGENLAAVCERELSEQSGITGNAVFYLGEWQTGYAGQIWGFYEMEITQALDETWNHYCADDNGHIFSFFWQPLESNLDEQWHPLFKGVIAYLKKHLPRPQD